MMTARREGQFHIAKHYDVMAQLDRDVHDDGALADSEVDLAMSLIDGPPTNLLLPCCGTGRHMGQFRRRGARRVVGVDLSPACLSRITPAVDRSVVCADLRTWNTTDIFDLVFLGGNSFGDLIDPEALLEVTRGMTHRLRRGGIFIMDYIGEGYLDRCRERRTTRWEATLGGRAVWDDRTPRFDPETRVMTIDVRVTAQDTGEQLWTGSYQKLILSDAEVIAHFAEVGIYDLRRLGTATELNPAYYGSHGGELGMIAKSSWWIGTRSGTWLGCQR